MRVYQLKFGKYTTRTYSMAQQTINIGDVANDGQGDPLRTAFTKTNDNFTELYNTVGGSVFKIPSLTTAQIANVSAANGDMVYNSSLNKFQGYENGAWVNLV